MESPAHEELRKRFQAAAANEAIQSARMIMLRAAGPCFEDCARNLQAAGFVQRDDESLSWALLCHIAAELCDGIATLVETRRFYAAGALLRQLVEVEYLAFLGYMDSPKLAKWYRSSSAELRSQFTPSKMRKASDGLFADHEYWIHCETGGHPHPRGRLLLGAYATGLTGAAHLVPDACHHIRRLWTSTRLAQENRGRIDVIVHARAVSFQSAREAWESVEDPLILSFDGVGHDPGESSYETR